MAFEESLTMPPLSARLLCFALSLSALAMSARAADWPQWRGPGRDGVWKESGIVDRFKSDRLEVLWRARIGAGYCGPTVADRRVYVMDRLEAPKQLERILCFDSKSGQKLWALQYECLYTIQYKAGPRASVTIDDGRAYALGAMGHLHCCDAAVGAVLWKKDLNAQYDIDMPTWGIAAAPLIVDDLVILHIGGRNGACVAALDKKDGREKWRALRDRAQYSAPILIEQAGRRVVVCWTGDSVAGLDPATGEVLWRYPLAPWKMPIGVPTPVVDNNRLFVSSFYDGSLLLALRQDRPAVEKIWRRRGLDERNTDALHAMISTPLFLGDYIYGVDSYGELRCLDARNGDRVWEDLTATVHDRWGNIHFVRNGDRIWMFNERGELIIATLSPRGFHEISRAKLIEPTRVQLNRRGGVCWSHPAFADRHVFIRNDEELVCASLEAD
jgi:outer membrane protein assembly factor BamB